MTDRSELEALLRTHYGVCNPEVRLLTDSWDASVYLVNRPASSPWVLRMVDTASALGDAQVLAFLERKRYPAPRLIRTTAGQETIDHGARSIIVTSFVEGTPADFSPNTLYRLAEKLGQLHTLEIDAKTCSLPPASMLPASDMATALEWLQPVASTVPVGLRGIYNRLLEAIHSIGDSGHLPRTIIHNDAHPGNAVIAADGSTVFIDWHGAGVGPAIVDLGFLLISSEIAPSWAPPLPMDKNRTRAIVDGYARHRVPTPAELNWLPDAMNFRALLYGAGHLATTATQGLDTPPEMWWWERYQAADDLAACVREEFGRCS
jgi:Ser/Thr protein kinase RdoA (MazF antagonist)